MTHTVAVAKITETAIPRRGRLVLTMLLLLGAACRPAPAPAPVSAPETTPLPPAADEDGAGVGATCGDAAPCVAPAECIEYYGIAGPKGPKFYACEIPCSDKGAKCPGDLQCITIADGPGQVCRPPGETPLGAAPPSARP